MFSRSSKRVSSSKSGRFVRPSGPYFWVDILVLLVLVATALSLLAEFIMQAVAGHDIPLTIANFWMMGIVVGDVYYYYYDNHKAGVFLYSVLILTALMLVINLRIHSTLPFLFMPAHVTVFLALAIFILFVHTCKLLW